jgi:single-strand DNA-binding protein
MHNSIQIIGNLGRDPEQREARASGAPFMVLSVATRRSWKNAQREWESRTDWHRVVCFNRLNDAAARLRRGDQVVINGSLVEQQIRATHKCESHLTRLSQRRSRICLIIGHRNATAPSVERPTTQYTPRVPQSFSAPRMKSLYTSF